MRKVLLAIGQGMIVIALFLLLTIGPGRRITILTLSLPVTGLVAPGLLAALKVDIDHFLLAGMAVGIGMIIDNGIIITDHLKKEPTIGLLIPVLLSSTLTSLIVLIPLFYLDKTLPGIGAVSTALFALLALSVILSIVFIPVAAGKGSAGRNPAALEEVRQMANPLKRINRGALALARFSHRHPLIGMGCILLILSGGILSLLFLPKEFSSLLPEPVIFVHLEFESGATLSSVDSRTFGFVEKLLPLPGIERIESIARRGNAQITVKYAEEGGFRPGIIEEIKKQGYTIPGGFVHLPELSSKEGTQIEVGITGPDHHRLKEIAHATLGVFSEEPWIDQSVLHFKEDPPAWIFHVSQDHFPLSGLSSSEIAERLRWNLQGPVAIKWQEGGMNWI